MEMITVLQEQEKIYTNKLIRRLSLPLLSLVNITRFITLVIFMLINVALFKI